MKSIYSVLLLLCPYMSRAVDTTGNGPRPLMIGDQMPDIVFTGMMNYGAATLNTKDIKAKLILLDFWATWCTACLSKFNLLDSVRTAYKGEVEIILVNSRSTHDDEGRILKLLSRLQNSRGKALQLPIAVGDTQAKKYFPHKSLPHYVWLNADKQVLAFSDGEAISPQNIKRGLQGLAPVGAANGNNYLFDITKPFAVNDNSAAARQLYSSNLLPGIAGMGVHAYMERRPDKMLTQRRYTNHTVLELLKNAHNKAPLPNQVWMDKQIPGAGNTYCYELITPLIPLAQSNEMMQQDLQRYFGVRAKMEVRLREVYVLTVDSVLMQKHVSRGEEPINALSDEGDRYMQNKSLQSLIELLYLTMDKPVVNESNYKALLNLRVPTEDFSFSNMQHLLSPMGIYLTKAQRRMDCFVIY